MFQWVMTHVAQTNVDGAVVGYARTSGPAQVAGLEDQIAELKRAGCTRIFSEHVSAVERRRPELEAALDWLRSGDVFIATSVYRALGLAEPDSGADSAEDSRGCTAAGPLA